MGATSPRLRSIATSILVLVLATIAPSPLVAQQVELVEVASGLALPVLVSEPPDGSGRLFIGEQGGLVRVLENGQLLAEPFLDLGPLSACCGEQGLLGLAFHSDFAANGLVFVHYSDNAGDTVIARYQVSATDHNRADPASAVVVLTVDQPYANHNGGQLAFGPDGYLYLGLGDGGSGGDPLSSGQRLDTLLGKILRVDVNRDDFPADPLRTYGVPASNPFLGSLTALPEIWAYGLRNPWRFSFDRRTGDLFIADVGQNAWEEVNYQPAGSSGGENYGWRLMEGTHCYNPATGCNDGSLTLPILEYSHTEGCSITGGFRYRGPTSPDLRGVYLYADYCTGTLWGASPDATGSWTSSVLLQSGLTISSFGEDASGEVYLVSYDAANGQVFRIVQAGMAAAILADGFETGDTSYWSQSVAAASQSSVRSASGRR